MKEFCLAGRIIDHVMMTGSQVITEVSCSIASSITNTQVIHFKIIYIAPGMAIHLQSMSIQDLKKEEGGAPSMRQTIKLLHIFTIKAPISC